MMGFKAGQCSNVALHNIFVGQCSGMGNTTGKYNVAIGRKTGGLVCGGTGICQKRSLKYALLIKSVLMIMDV